MDNADEFQGQRFCQDCNNLLYAEERVDRIQKTAELIYKCKMCGLPEEVGENAPEHEYCVYKTDLEAKAERLIINPDIVDDPTLAKRQIDQCRTEECNSNQVVTFYHITKDHFNLIYVCIKCRNFWKMNEKDHKYDIDTDTDEEDKK